MVLLDGGTGLRRSALIALRSRNVDLESGTTYITKSVHRNVEGKTKTRASKKPVPLPEQVIEELKTWKEASRYKKEDLSTFERHDRIEK